MPQTNPIGNSLLALLRVGGPSTVDWPANNPSISLITYEDNKFHIWTDEPCSPSMSTTSFLILQSTDQLQYKANLIREMEVPYFGSCRVYRLLENP